MRHFMHLFHGPVGFFGTAVEGHILLVVLYPKLYPVFSFIGHLIGVNLDWMHYE